MRIVKKAVKCSTDLALKGNKSLVVVMLIKSRQTRMSTLHAAFLGKLSSFNCWRNKFKSEFEPYSEGWLIIIFCALFREQTFCPVRTDILC